MTPELASAVAVAGIMTTAIAPGLQRYIGAAAIRRRARAGRRLVLTYDDGPGSRLTPALLELLRSYKAPATFFVLGSRVKGNESLLDRIVGERHEVGCHGQEHLHAWKVSPWRAARDICAGYASLSRWAGPNATFRPPFGKLTLITTVSLLRRHAPLAWWTIDSGDTHAILPTSQTIADAAIRAGGGVVLMHDFDRSARHAARGEFVLRTTELLLEMARREGLTVCRYRDLWEPESA